MLDLDKFDAALKVHYGPQKLEKAGYEGRPLLAMLSKYTKMGGKTTPYPIHFAGPQNLAAGFSEANRINSGDPASSSSTLAEFVVTRKRKYGMVQLDRETMLASVGDKNAFARATITEIDAGLEGFNNEVHAGLYKSGTGARAQIGSVAGTTITLASVADVSRLEVGMALQISTTDTVTSALVADIRTVTGVDRDAGTFTVDTAFTGAAAGDWIFRYGDRQQGAITNESQWLNTPGLPDILPDAAPTSGDSFRMVDRSQDTTRLAGHRIAWDTNYRTTLMNAGVEFGRSGAAGDKVLFVNHTDLAGIMAEYSDNLTHETLTAPGMLSIGFKAFSVSTPMGDVKVVADHQCPVGKGYCLTMADWELVSLNAVPHFIDEAGKFLRSHTDDSFKVEFVAYYALACKKPSRSGVIFFS